MQSASSKIWTGIYESISKDNNHERLFLLRNAFKSK